MGLLNELQTLQATNQLQSAPPPSIIVGRFGFESFCSIWSAQVPTSCLLTRGGSENCSDDIFLLRPENKYFGNSSSADCTYSSIQFIHSGSVNDFAVLGGWKEDFTLLGCSSRHLIQSWTRYLRSGMWCVFKGEQSGSISAWQPADYG